MYDQVNFFRMRKSVIVFEELIFPPKELFAELHLIQEVMQCPSAMVVWCKVRRVAGGGGGSSPLQYETSAQMLTRGTHNTKDVAVN